MTARIWTGAARRAAGSVTLESPVTPWDPTRFDRARLLLIDNQTVLGWKEAVSHELSLSTLLGLFPSSEESPVRSSSRVTVTAVICTRQRPEELRRCLEEVARALGPADQVLVVDNAPVSDATAAVVEDFRFRMPITRLVEPRPGLSRARNAALHASTSDILAFTDDDVLVDSHWLEATRRGFDQSPDVALVTGLVPPAELATESQVHFESMLRWSSAVNRRVYRMKGRSDYDIPLFPYSPGYFGTGANMAVRREVALSIGGFDPALGAGTRSRGGEDLEMFVRVLRAGWALAVEPDSIAWHVHRRDEEASKSQFFGYGSGLTAYLTSLLARPGRADLAASIARSRKGLISRPTQARSALTPELVRTELKGMAWGPFAYLTDRARNRLGR
ncbi:MAG: glycosyltransferase family 2 protein [Acidimicrobiales bacterium]